MRKRPLMVRVYHHFRRRRHRRHRHRRNRRWALVSNAQDFGRTIEHHTVFEHSRMLIVWIEHTRIAAVETL